MGLAWLNLVLDAWNFPAWVRESLLALVSGQGVRAWVAGGMGAVRAIRRGLGIGGPASPFLWCLGYDPIIFALEQATGTEPPTYVDDLAGLVWGPAHALRAEIFLLAAGHLAGLRID
eukprot:9302402-Heterocapsa_arctica.AAC.1